MCKGRERSASYVPDGLRQRGLVVGGVVGVEVFFLFNFLELNFSGVHFEHVENVTGVEILRQRITILCKSCQTIL